MATIKTWADGELFTPAAMNDLVGSTYMRFPDAATRDTLLVGDLAPVSGMTAFMLDTSQLLTYVTASGGGVWMPQPSGLCFFARQQAVQTLPLNTYTAITNFVPGEYASRNLFGWFDYASGKFTPKVPGVYEFVGGVSMYLSPTGNGFAHRVGFRMNGTGNMAFILASENRQIVTSNVAVSFSTRKFVQAMNGTTDYMELVAYAAVASSTSIGAQSPTFGAKYLGQ